jgi:hypothetical protein
MFGRADSPEAYECLHRHTPAVQYHEAFSDLAGVYLEDSWVLELARTDRELALRIDAVLTPAHPGYEPAKPGEQHCHRRGWLSVCGDSIETHLSGSRPSTDATGEEDFGNVDAFVFDPTNDHWLLEGDWGSARVHDPEVTLRFE